MGAGTGKKRGEAATDASKAGNIPCTTGVWLGVHMFRSRFGTFCLSLCYGDLSRCSRAEVAPDATDIPCPYIRHSTVYNYITRVDCGGNNRD